MPERSGEIYSAGREYRQETERGAVLRWVRFLWVVWTRCTKSIFLLIEVWAHFRRDLCYLKYRKTPIHYIVFATPHKRIPSPKEKGQRSSAVLFLYVEKSNCPVRFAHLLRKARPYSSKAKAGRTLNVTPGACTRPPGERQLRLTQLQKRESLPDRNGLRMNSE